MQQNIGIGFVTGRKQFQNLLRTYVNNWLEHGLIQNKDVRLHLFVVYDVSYTNTEPNDYKTIPSDLSEMVESINFYGRKALMDERQKLIDEEVIDQSEGDLLFGEGYAKKRNAALYFALRKGMDKLLFIDDDEYPLAVLKNDSNHLVWMGQSVLGTHLKYGDDADITHGHHCGYISPMPKIAFNDQLTKDDFRAFIDALSNDIISWETVEKTIIGNNGITFADESVINHGSISEVPETFGMKFISGANLCFNLRRLRSIPAFYNPPGARGEDAFMSTTLSSNKVIKVPCYTFHDAFLEYKNILNGVLPIELGGVQPCSTAVRRRFINAAIGWVRYKPLLTFITQPENYEAIIDEMTTKLEYAIPKLCRYFDTRRFEEIPIELKKYHRNVRRHHLAFEATRRAWTKAIQALVFVPLFAPACLMYQ
jgi:hypothetical protein